LGSKPSSINTCFLTVAFPARLYPFNIRLSNKAVS
jgi:hypothetical protein